MRAGNTVQLPPATSTSFYFKVNDSLGLMAVVNLKLEVITLVTYVIISLLLISLQLFHDLRAHYISCICCSFPFLIKPIHQLPPYCLQTRENWLVPHFHHPCIEALRNVVQQYVIAATRFESMA
jgi:hypothetical protein